MLRSSYEYERGRAASVVDPGVCQRCQRVLTCLECVYVFVCVYVSYKLLHDLLLHSSYEYERGRVASAVDPSVCQRCQRVLTCPVCVYVCMYFMYCFMSWCALQL